MEKYYLTDDDYEVNVPSITAFYTDNHPSVIDRYFTRYFLPRQSANGENEDHLILYHSNHICLLGLAPSHVAFTKGITNINFNIGNVDRSQKIVTGKSKKGGMNLQPLTAIAVIQCKDGSEYKVVSGVTGKLLEINDHLNIETLAKEGDGYIAIILCKQENHEKMKSALISEECYKANT